MGVNEINRTPIPKKDGGIRYINDPGVPWRCYLWMWNLMIHYYANPRINANQHGHRAGKGSVTCWKQILTEVIDSKFIYEFDYKKFHDLISRAGMAGALLRFGFPEEVARTLVHICSPYVRGADDNDPLRLKLAHMGEYHHYYRGVVQGNNVAALLGMIVLEDLGVYDLKHGQLVGYADDGILYGDDPRMVEEWLSKLDPKMGVFPKPAATKWVRFSGEWKSELKFVGLAYDGSTDTLRANTRSGKTEVFKWDREEGITPDVEEFLRLSRTGESSQSGHNSAPYQRTLTHRNGVPYLGFLLAKIWSNDPRSRYEPGETAKLKYKPESLLGKWNKFGDWPFSMNAINASSQAYGYLGKWIKLYEPASLRQPVAHRLRRGTGIFKGVPRTEARALSEMMEPWKFSGPAGSLITEGNEVLGDVTSLPVGMDMLPSFQSIPTPRWLRAGEVPFNWAEGFLVAQRPRESNRISSSTKREIRPIQARPDDTPPSYDELRFERALAKRVKAVWTKGIGVVLKKRVENLRNRAMKRAGSVMANTKVAKSCKSG
uniref:Mystique n=1 Tax=Phycomyces blakesleeanus TaxID=4837 RepID=A0A3G2C535_PHYBL|nr:mystique [Phycomyces blakesleeanus]